MENAIASQDGLPPGLDLLSHSAYCATDEASLVMLGLFTTQVLSQVRPAGHHEETIISGAVCLIFLFSRRSMKSDSFLPEA